MKTRESETALGSSSNDMMVDVLAPGFRKSEGVRGQIRRRKTTT